MNNKRRKSLTKVFEMLSKCTEIIETVKEEERESMENLPESLRYGSRGEDMQNNIEMLEETSNYIDDARSVIEQI